MTRPGGSAAASVSIAAVNAASSDAEPLCGRKYTLTPAGVAACSALTCRPMLRSAAHPLATRAESSYAPANRTAVRSRCSREASATAGNPPIAASISSPRTFSATGASASSARPSRSSFSSMAGTPSSSPTAAEDAHPAMSYSGDGEHSRLAASTAITSPCVSKARPRTGTSASTSFTRPSR